MIRPLHPVDVARYALRDSGTGNRVWTLDALGKEPSRGLSVVEAARLGLSVQSKASCAYCWTEGNQVLGIAAARPRSGKRTWEISSLLLASGDDRVCVDLLSRVCQEVASRGGERVFIRLGSEEPLLHAARLSGFFPCVMERLCQGKRQVAQRPRGISMRGKRRHDDYGLFRLYNAATPSETRFAYGVTFEQWSSARERSRGRSRDFVYERDGQVRGWLKTTRRLTSGNLFLMIHPGDQTSLLGLIDYGLARLGGTNTVFCLVPTHQVLVERLLAQKGYAVTSEYVTLVKSMAIPAWKEKLRRAVNVAPT